MKNTKLELKPFSGADYNAYSPSDPEPKIGHSYGMTVMQDGRDVVLEQEGHDEWHVRLPTRHIAELVATDILNRLDPASHTSLREIREDAGMRKIG